MGLRYYRSIGLGNLFRINISKSGIGFSAGVAGLRVSTGPHGSFFTVNLPGTGLSYRKQIGSRARARQQAEPEETKAQAVPEPPEPPQIPSPGLFAPRHEKELAEGLKAYQAGRTSEALDSFLNAASEEPGAAVLAAMILSQEQRGEPQAIRLLERVVQAEAEFPTPLMEKYLITHMNLKIDVTPAVSVEVPLSALGLTLFLVELYQRQGRLEEAIGLLEEVEELANDPVVTLSLCDLYASRGLWDGIIDRAKNIEPEDDVTLETVILYGLAMQEKGMHEAAITVFTKALRKKKDRNPDLLREAMYWRAVSYHEMGRHSQANKEFQKLYAEAPDFRDVAERIEALSR